MSDDTGDRLDNVRAFGQLFARRANDDIATGFAAYSTGVGVFLWFDPPSAAAWIGLAAVFGLIYTGFSLYTHLLKFAFSGALGIVLLMLVSSQLAIWRGDVIRAYAYGFSSAALFAWCGYHFTQYWTAHRKTYVRPEPFRFSRGAVLQHRSSAASTRTSVTLTISPR